MPKRTTSRTSFRLIGLLMLVGFLLLAVACVKVNPGTADRSVGETHEVTVSISNPSPALFQCVNTGEPPPESGATIRFEVTGAHSIGPTDELTDGNGEATFSYLSANVTGPVEGTSATWLRPSVGLGASLFSCRLHGD